MGTITELWDTYGDTVKSTCSTACTCAQVAEKILEMTGVIESTDAKIDKVYNKLCQMDSKVDQILTEIKNLQKQIGALEDLVQYRDYKDAWVPFRDEYFKKLRTDYYDFIIKYHGELVTLVRGTAGVTVYKDSSGVTVRAYGKSYDNNEIISSKTYKQHLDEGVAQDYMREMKEYNTANSTAVYPGLMNEVESAMKQIYGPEEGQDVYDSILLQASYLASLHCSGLVKSFINTFSRLCDKETGTLMPLDAFDFMLAYLYNFDAETYEIKDTIRMDILMLAVNGFAAAACIRRFLSPGASMTDLSSLFDRIKKYMKENTGRIAVDSGYVYCFPAKKQLRLRQAQVECWLDANKERGCTTLHVVGNYSEEPYIAWAGITNRGHQSNNPVNPSYSFTEDCLHELLARSGRLGYTCLKDELAAVFPKELLSDISFLDREELIVKNLRSEFHKDNGADLHAQTCYSAGGGRYTVGQDYTHDNWDAVENIKADMISITENRYDNDVVIGRNVYHLKKGNDYYFQERVRWKYLVFESK